MAVPSLTKIPEWLIVVADVLVYAAAAFSIASAASWFGLDNFIVAIALAVAAAYLLFQIAPQVRDFLRGIIMTIFEALVELVEFLGAWLQAIAQHGFKAIIQAVVRMVALAAFMWVFDLARGIPVIGKILDLIVDTASRITKFINDTIDGVLRELEKLRLQIVGGIQGMLDRLGAVGKAIREDVLRIVDGLFSGVRSELQQLRFELLGKFDLVSAALKLEVEILGQKIRLVPQEVLALLRDRFTTAAREDEMAARNAAASGQPAAVGDGAPWVAVEVALAEVQVAISGVPAVTGAEGEPYLDELDRLVAQAPAYIRGWLRDRVADLRQRIVALPTTTQPYADEAVRQFKAVVAGTPPMLEDVPRALFPPPPPAPAPPERP